VGSACIGGWRSGSWIVAYWGDLWQWDLRRACGGFAGIISFW